MNLPSLYLIRGTGLSETQKDFIRNALSITPIIGVIVPRPELIELAREFSNYVLFDPDEQSALISKYLPITQDLNSPVAIVADFTSPFTGVHSDATQEIIQC